MKITDFTLRAPENTSIGTSGATGGVIISGSASSNYVIAATSSNTAIWQPKEASGGVTSISHSSNTFTGAITLQPEGSTYIVSPSTGTFTIGARGGTGSGVTDHGTLTGLDGDDHSAYVTVTGGGGETLSSVAASGSTETLDLANGNVHDVTLTDNCTITLTGATNGVACSMTIILRQDSTGGRTVTWPASVVWIGDDAPVLETAASAFDVIELLTIDGGTNWIGTHGAAPATNAVGELLIADSHSTPLVFADLLQNEDQDDLLYADT